MTCTDCEKKFCLRCYAFRYTFFFLVLFYIILKLSLCVSGIPSVNLIRMMMNTAVLHVKGFAIVLFVVVNGVKHTLEPVDAINIIHHHQHNALLVSGLVPKRTYHHLHRHHPRRRSRLRRFRRELRMLGVRCIIFILFGGRRWWRVFVDGFGWEWWSTGIGRSGRFVFVVLLTFFKLIYMRFVFFFFRKIFFCQVLLKMEMLLVPFFLHWRLVVLQLCLPCLRCDDDI